MILSHIECLERLGTRQAIAKAVAKGELFKIERGIYADKAYVPFVEVALKRYPEAFVTLDSAFFYQGLTDIVPEALHLACAREATRSNDKRIVQHFVPEKILHLGECEVEYNGSKLRTYNLERLAIEVARMKSKLPPDLYKEVVLSLRGRVGEMYPAKIDDYLVEFTYRDKIMETIRKEIF